MPRLVCHVCSKHSYARIQGLQKHLRTEHPAEYENARAKKPKSFFCDCGKSYSSKQSLWGHLQRDKGSQCVLCPRGYHHKAIHLKTCPGRQPKVVPKTVVCRSPIVTPKHEHEPEQVEEDDGDDQEDDENEQAFKSFWSRKRKREEEEVECENFE